MARSRSGFYQTIEYIGPRPQKPRKQGSVVGWLVMILAIGAGIYLGKPLVGEAMAADRGPSIAESEVLVGKLEKSELFGDRLGAEALRYANRGVQYDSAYHQLEYPLGDLAAHKGMAADLVVRCYRELGIDLQEELHEDIKKRFRAYPQLWNADGPDKNIDHRRVANLMRFFARQGAGLSVDKAPQNFETGDIIVWTLANAEAHLGIVVPGPKGYENSRWVVHHPSGGPVTWESSLFKHQILGHFRYSGGE